MSLASRAMNRLRKPYRNVLAHIREAHPGLGSSAWAASVPHSPCELEPLEPRLLLDGTSADAVYLLITDTALEGSFQALKERRIADGLTAQILTTDDIYKSPNYPGTRPDGGSDHQTQIRECIIDYWQHHGTQFVVLAGDETIVPVRMQEQGYCSDLYYADLQGDWDANADGLYGEVDVDGVDYIADVLVGRIPVRTAEQAEDYVAKLIRYEERSPEGFADSLLVMGLDDAFHTGTARPEGYIDHDPVGQFEYVARKVYTGAVQDFWQAAPYDVYFNTITSWDTAKSGDYEVTYQNTIEVLNRGYHHVLLDAHGGETYAAYLDSTLVAPQLSNSDTPSIFYSVACSTSAFHQAEPSLSEALIRNRNGGAVAYIGYTGSGWGTTAGAIEFYRQLYQEGCATIGEAFYTQLETLKESLGTEWLWYQHCLNLQGDPALRVLERESGRTLRLDSPNGAELYDIGANITIHWSAAGTGFAPGNLVDLDYSSDGGATWGPVPGGHGLPYDAGCYVWDTDTPEPGENCRFRVTYTSDASVSDTSDRDSRIAEMGLLTVLSSPAPTLKISGSHGSSTSYNHTVELGQEIVLTAPALDGYNFLRWADGTGATVTSEATVIIEEFTGDMTLVAEYELSGEMRTFYVNDDIPDEGFAAGDDGNDGLSPVAPMWHIQEVLKRYSDVGTIQLAPGDYYETLVVDSSHHGLKVVGAGKYLTSIDGKGLGTVLSLEDVYEVVIEDLTIRGGTSASGGGVYADGSVVTFDDVDFVNNLATNGGGIYLWDGEATFQDCEFRGNEATQYGGGIFCIGGSVIQIQDCAFVDNEANSGGAISVYPGSRVTVKFSEFAGNTAAAYGGAIWMYGGDWLEVSSCAFDGCHSDVYSGAVHWTSGNGVIQRNLFQGNTSGSYGGAIGIFEALTVRDNVFCGNTAGIRGGGIYGNHEEIVLANNTLTENTAGNAGGGICLGDIAQAMVTGTILWGNEAPTAAELFVHETGVAAVEYCDIMGGWDGEGNLNANPMFVRAPSDGGDGWGVGDNDDYGDLHLRNDSVCINAGDPEGDYTGQTDMDHQPRVAYGRVDIGADEFLLLGDANLDEVVDAADYIAMKRNFGTTGGAAWAGGDLDGDGDVDWYDLQTLIANMGSSLGAAPTVAEPVTPKPITAEPVPDAVAEPDLPPTPVADAVVESELPPTPVADAPDPDILAIAASVLSNRLAAGRHVVPPSSSGPANLLPPSRVAVHLGPLPTFPSPLLSLGRSFPVVADVLQLAAPWWSGDSAKHESPDEPWMTRLTGDIAGKPRKGRLDPLGLDVLAVSR